MAYAYFSDLKDKILVSATATDNSLTLVTYEGESYDLYPEDGPPNDVEVWIESIVGDLDDLLFEPILMAEEATNSEESNDLNPEYTWTFYKLATRKGYVDIRFAGRSNGYYSEKASLHVSTIDISPYLAAIAEDRKEKLEAQLANKDIDSKKMKL